MAVTSLTTRYDAVNNKTCAVGTVAFDGSDVNLSVSVTDSSPYSSTGVSLNSFSLDKPGSFSIDYNFHDKDVRFQFMNSFRVLNKPANLTYSHSRYDNQTELNGTLVLNSANNLSGSYDFCSGDSKLKYSYVHKDSTMVEPGYDFGRKAWDLAVSQKLYGGDMVSASYQSDSKVLKTSLKTSSGNGSLKVSASLNLAEKMKFPKITVESAWNVDM